MIMHAITSLRKVFNNIIIETFESKHSKDLCFDIDYLGWVGKKAFGIQIKPVTAKSNFGGYSLSERMKASFEDFETQYGGKVFIVYSLDDEIANKEILAEITNEILKLSAL
jgi:hypothetical protein